MKVFLILKNADFTEGRGPMVFHRAYSKKEYAHDYIMAQPGIYGSKQGYDAKYDSYNGYDLKEVEVIDVAPKNERKLELLKELQKAQDEVARIKAMLI